MAADYKTITREQATSELDEVLSTLDPLPEAMAQQTPIEQRVVKGRLPSFPQTPDEITDRLAMAAIRYAIQSTDLEAEQQREAKERTEAARAARPRDRCFGWHSGSRPWPAGR